MKHAKPSHLTYKCGICGKKLTSKQNLFQHITIHTGEKPLKCSFPGCSASFKHASQLSSHKTLHIKNAPNRLDFSCLKSFVLLLLELFESERNEEYSIPAGPFTAADVNLPSVRSTQSSVQLPGLSTFNSTF
jgi:uncharacterized Zn-finger protein